MAETEIFKETRQITPCSYNKCSNGHTWRPTIAVAQCPSCTGPVLARKLENCPICNEPVVHTAIRTDLIPAKSGIARLCTGEPGRGEHSVIELDCHHFAAIEAVATPE